MKLAIYTFPNTFASKLWIVLSSSEFFVINNHNYSELLDYVNKSSIDLVIGLGDYGGKDNKTLRIESYCTNTFRNLIDGDNKMQFPLYVPANVPKEWNIGKWMGNGHCNYSCYFLSQYLWNNNTNISFIHIPKLAQKYSINSLIQYLQSF